MNTDTENQNTTENDTPTTEVNDKQAPQADDKAEQVNVDKDSSCCGSCS